MDVKEFIYENDMRTILFITITVEKAGFLERGSNIWVLIKQWVSWKGSASL